MNLPNILTLLRIVIIPFFTWRFLIGDVVGAIILLLASGFTDFLDGFIARKFNLITKTGALLDPLADKLTQIVVSFCIAYNGFELMWIVFGFLVLKEVFMIIGGVKLYADDDIVIHAKWYGKVATFVIYLSFYLLILFGGIMHDNVKLVIIVTALGFSLLAFINYFIQFLNIQKNKTEKVTR